MQPETLLHLILLAPFVAALSIGVYLRRSAALSTALSVGSCGLQMLATLYLLWGHSWDGHTDIVRNLEWMRLGDFSFQVGYLFDRQASAMLFVVTFVGFWIHLFSIGYMKDDEARSRFYLGLSIFMFAMTGLVLASNLFMLFIFWELVGFSSYLLIGHYQTARAASAANKAFIVNRVGDFAFLLGILWTYWQMGTTDLLALRAQVQEHPHLLLNWMSLLLIGGVLGKSAQVPLHVWLPDAMEGPTPVSALIHAATMVAAGVYLLGRIYFLYTADALSVIIAIGSITAVMSAVCAFGVRDIKKILAFSTLSQLGYLVAVFGLGTEYAMRPEVMATQGEHGSLLYGVGAASFHLTTHAFFKALLFLGAGSIILGLHHEQDIFKMGGLWKTMPWTSLTFALGVLAIAGLPPFSGFHSKDAILYLAFVDNRGIFYVLTGTALLTAVYMGRLWFVAFWGKPRSTNAEHAQESPWYMLVALAVLSVYSALGGYRFVYPEPLHQLLFESVLHPQDPSMMLVISLIAGGGGLLLALWIYGLGAENDRVEEKFPLLYRFCSSQFYFDKLYGFYVRNLQDRVAMILHFLDMLLISGLLVRGTAGLVALLGYVSRLTLNGNLQTYLYWSMGGLLVFWFYASGIF